MRFSTRLLAVLSLGGLLGTLAACGGGSTTPPPPATTYSISGTISGAASVTVALSGAATATTTTDGAGGYTFTGLANGAYTVTPSKAGYAFSPLSTAVTVAGASSTGRNFTATAAATTWSIPVAVTGAVQSGVTLTLTQAGTTLGTAITGTGGLYTFAGLLDGSYTVTPSLAGYTFLPASSNVTVAGANSPTQTFAATAISYTVSGHVGGASAVTVTVTGSPAPPPAVTDGAGNYSFSLPGGSYTITPSKAGYAFTPASAAVVVAGASVTVPNFTGAVSSTFTLSGTVTGPWVQGVTIALSGASTATTTTDVNGAYTISGIPNDTVTVTPSLDGYTFSPAAPTVTMAGAAKTQHFTATSAIPSHSISGTVTYGGGKLGRVVVSAYWSGCSNNCSPQAITSLAAPGAYTLRGLLNGTYAVSARLDSGGQGAQNASDPTGMSAGSVNVNNADVPGVNVALSDPMTTPTPATLAAPNLLPGNGGVLLFWNVDKDLSQREKATSYDVSFGATSTADTTVVNVPARDDGVYFRSGLVTGTTYHFKVRSNVGATNGTYSPVAAGTIGPVAGGFTVSGTVSFPVPATGPLYLAIGDGNTGNLQVSAYATPLTSPVSFTVTGLPAGTWGVYAILDQNGNGTIDDGDLKNVNGGDAPMVTVGPSQAGLTVALTATKGFATTATEHSLNQGGTSHGYGLQNTVAGNLQRVVKAAVVAGKHIAVPADLGGSREFYAWSNLASPAVPAVGDAYTFQVTYADGSTELLTSTVTAVLSSFARNLGEDTTTLGTAAQPYFTWSAPASPPANYGYSLSVWGSANWYYPRDAWMVPSGVTGVRYNVDGTASATNLTTGTYTWSVTVYDAAKNRARQEKIYIVP